MADGFGVIRSYQRIFRPERRIYQVDNHRLPVPGGVPLSWLGYAVGTLLAVIVLSTQGEELLIIAGLAAAVGGWLVGGRLSAVLAAAVAIVAVFVAGTVLAVLDWPLRLLVVPALVATLLTQATPDGRPAHRYLISWVGLRLRSAHRSAGRPLSPAGLLQVFGARLWVAADQRSPWLRHGRTHGPATVEFVRPVLVRPAVLARRLRVARPTGVSRGLSRKTAPVAAVTLAERERLEVRP